MIASQIGPGVYLDEAVCIVLRTVLRSAIERNDQLGIDVPPVARDAVAAIEDAAADCEARIRSSDHGPLSTTGSESVLMIDFMTTAQTAAQLGCGERNVRKLAAAGVLRSLTTSGPKLFAPSEVDVVARNRQEAG